MFWILLLLALGFSALWFSVDSTERTEVSEEELLARYGVTWQQTDPLAYAQATELAAARLTMRAYAVAPARSTAHRGAHSRTQA